MQLTCYALQDKDLVNLEPIRRYQHLQFVNVSNNKIANVSPLSDLPYLICVNLSENALTTPPVFSNTYLQVQHTAIHDSLSPILILYESCSQSIYLKIN